MKVIKKAVNIDMNFASFTSKKTQRKHGHLPYTVLLMSVAIGLMNQTWSFG